MNELIKIQDFDGSGKRAVSARELYEGLGYDPSQWARWYRKNIVNNRFAIENEDYSKLDMMSRSIDFALTIDFAKKLSMMARTPEGEKIRDYFIEVEKHFAEIKSPGKPLSIAEMMLISTQMLEQSAQLHIQHEKKFKELEVKQLAIEEKVDEIREIQKQNQVELFALPLSSKQADPISLRKQVSILVNRYAAAENIPHQSVWNNLYQNLENRYHIRLSAYKKNPCW